jgi:hypothetical protein
MKIGCLENTKWSKKENRFLLEEPSFRYSPSDFKVYTVQKGEDMRIDLVMQSIYDDPYSFEHIDVILHINDIDNPLNIREGQEILYLDINSLDSYRYYPTESDRTKYNKSVQKALAVPSKSTRKDDNRKKFIEGNYSLPPTVLKESRPPVRIDSNNIIVGGIN